MDLRKSWEKVAVKAWPLRVEGNLCFDRRVLDLFQGAPWDMLPEFQGPPQSKLWGGRGKDHPRYGRFVYAFAKHYRPEAIVEVGTYAGGTSVGWARALIENGRGKLHCVDNDTYSKDTFPKITQTNLDKAGLAAAQLELLNGDSKAVLPALAERLKGKVDIYLVDGDHTYEGALRDIENGLPMLKPGGFLLVHDIDRNRRMDEQTPEHPHPVHEAFMQVVQKHNLDWCILKFIRKHLGVAKVR